MHFKFRMYSQGPNLKKRWGKNLGFPIVVNVITGEGKDRTTVVWEKIKCPVSLTLTEKLPSCRKKSVTATKNWWGAEFGRNCEKSRQCPVNPYQNSARRT